MSTWVIVSWVFVAVLTGVNIFVFLKLKGASEQMLKMAFPNAKNMNDALSQMQKMMGGRMPGGMGAKNANTDAQLKQAMAMLKNLKK
jgi:hypothetical protein